MNISKIIKQVSVVGAFGLLGVMSPDGAQAVTATDSFVITTTVTATCTVDATNALTGGPLAYDYVTGAADTGTIDVVCTQGAPWVLTLNNGLHSVANGGPGVSLASDPLGPFMDYSITALPGSGNGNGALPDVVAVSLTIAGGQNPVAGTYDDTVGVTVSY